jgi:hypothetical protein
MRGALDTEGGYGDTRYLDTEVVVVKSSPNRLRFPDWATAARLSIAAGVIALCLFGGLGLGFLYLPAIS